MTAQKEQANAEKEQVNFIFHDDKPPYSVVDPKIQPSIGKHFKDAFYQQAVVVKQLMSEPNPDTFAVAMFSPDEYIEETCRTLIFNRENDRWSDP